MKLGFDERRTAGGGYSRSFLLTFILMLIPSLAIWFFYRWLFENDISWWAAGIISVVTAWFWAYLVGYGGDQHTED